MDTDNIGRSWDLLQTGNTLDNVAGMQGDMGTYSGLEFLFPEKC